MSTEVPSRLAFEIEFYAPFHVLMGRAGGGLDDIVDEQEPLSASSLKGTMRAAASLIGFSESIVDETFGSERDGSRWSWSMPRLEGADRRAVLSRVAIDPESGTVLPDHLQVTEMLFPSSGSFEVLLRTRQGATEYDLDQQAVVLAASACAVKGIGAHRRRGLGWIGIRPSERTASHLDERARTHLDGSADWLGWVDRLLGQAAGGAA